MMSKTTTTAVALTIVLGSLAFVPGTGAHHDGALPATVQILDLDYDTAKTDIFGFGDGAILEVQDIGRTSQSSVTAVASSPSDPTGESITLRRHTAHTNVPTEMRDSFFAALTFESVAVAGNGRLRVVDGETFTVQYTDAGNVLRQDTAVFHTRSTGTLATDATTYFGHAAAATACAAPAGAKLTIVDNDLDTSGVANTGSVEVRSNVAPNTLITVPITETGATSGIFEGRLCFSNDAAVDANDRIQVKEGAVVTVTYKDAANVQGVAVDAARSLLWRQAQTGLPEFYPVGFNGVAPTLTVIGDTAHVHVLDRDRDTTSSADTFTATVESRIGAPAGGLRSGPLTVVLTESGPNTGEFLGTVGLATVATAGKLTVVDGDELLARYDDSRDGTGIDPASANTDASNVVWDRTTDGTVRLVRSDMLTDNTDYYGVGGGLYGALFIRVEDADGDTTGAADTLRVAVTSGLDPRGLVDFPAGGAIGIDLTETGGSTGIFTGSAPFTTDPAMTANALLVQDRSPVAVAYQDVNAAGVSVVRSDSAVWHVAETGTPIVDLATFAGPSTPTLGNFATVTLLDADRNVAAATKDTLVVKAASVLAGQEIFVTLTEVEENAGLFRGTFGFTTGANSDSTDTLKVSSPDTFIVSYDDPQNAAGSPVTTAAAPAAWTAAGAASVLLESAKFFGTTGTQRVLLIDSAIATATTPACVESTSDLVGVALTLTETVAGSKVFAGTFGFTAAASSGTTVMVAAGNTVRAHQGACAAGVSVAAQDTAVWNPGADGTVDFMASATPPTTGFTATRPSTDKDFGIVFPANLQVLDLDADRDSDARDVLEVAVGDETIALLETGVTTGLFRRAALYESTATATSGKIALTSGGTLTLSYTDGLPTTGTSAVLTDTLKWFAPGTMRFTETSGGTTAPSFVGLRTVFVELTDAFFNTDINTAQTPTVVLLSQPASPVVGDGGAADTEPVILTETGPDTGVFRGSIVLGAGAGLLGVGGGVNARDDTLTARVIKDRPAGGAADDGDIVETTALWAKAEAGIVLLTDQPPLPDTPAVAYGPDGDGFYFGQSNGFLQVVDAGVNANPAVAEALDVKVSSLSDLTGITVTLRETLGNSGIFRGRFTFTTGASSDSSDLLKVVHNDPVNVAYTDARRDDGTQGAIGNSNAVTWKDSTSATLALSKRKVGGADTLVLTITDKDQDSSGAADTITIPTANIEGFNQPFPNLGSAVAGQVDSLVLTETGAGTGIFAATLSFVLADTASGNQVVVSATNGGSRVKVTYTEALDSTGQTPRAKSVELFWYDVTDPGANGNGFVQFDAAAYPNVSSVATITVTEPDPTCTALSAVTADSGTVLVVSSSDGRGEIVTLTETGVNTRVFVGLVGFESGLTAANGKVGVATGDLIAVFHYDGQRDGATCAAGESPSPVFVDRDIARFGVTAAANPTAGLSVLPTSGAAAPLSVNFTLTGSDSDGIVVSYTLSFGDGTSPQVGTTLPATVQHTYAASGTFTAILTVTDNAGLTGTTNVTVTVGGSTTSSTGPSTTTTPPTTGPTTTGPTTTSPTSITPAALQAANERVVVTVERVGDSNVISWTLPTSGLPGPVLGVQLWRHNSPYTLIQTFPVDSATFRAGTFTDSGPEALASTKYLVTMFFGPSAALGLFTQSTAPDDSVYPGLASTDDQPGDGGGGDGLPTWAIILIVVGLLFLVVLVALLIARSRRDSQEPAATEQQYAWQESSEAKAADAEWEGGAAAPGTEVHQARCPSCATTFTTTGQKPIVTVCPGCGKKGVLR